MMIDTNIIRILISQKYVFINELSNQLPPKFKKKMGSYILNPFLKKKN
ncbi:MAG: hypothetical protein CM15mP40_12790 [Alphaproteobacteria bacterium]|nr:MAG: hypothetical protein CM15mP40_12790 [Alphaproteobacteria bacterium]